MRPPRNSGMFADDVEDDPYSTLGVTWGASAESIRRAFRTLARLHHPDRNPGNPQAEARFKLISAAFQRLKAAGWSLPRPSASSIPVADDTDAPEPEYHRPQYWPDGSRSTIPRARKSMLCCEMRRARRCFVASAS